MEDRELKQLLREWKAPAAPPHLRPPRGPMSPLRWLVGGTIRVPVPVALVAVLLAAVWMGSAWQARSATLDTSGQRRSGELARHALQGPLAGFDAVVAEVNFSPGASSSPHRHPGFILGYVVNGQMRFGIDNGPDQIVPAGGTFFEPPGVLHTTFGSASRDSPVRCVMFLVVPNGSPLTSRP